MNTNFPDSNEEKNLVASLPRRIRGPNVSLEDVRIAVLKLQRSGLPATARNVITEVGGSKGTVLKYLAEIQDAEHALTLVEVSALSSQVTRALATDIERLVRERTSKVDSMLRESRSAVELLADECEMQRFNAHRTAESLVTCQSTVAEQTGTNKALREELCIAERLVNTLRSEAETARQSCALREAEVRRTSELLEVCQRTIEEQNRAIGAMREEARLGDIQLSSSRSEAEAARQSRVLIDSELQGVRARILSVEGELMACREEHAATQRELEESRLRHASMDGERTSLQERFAEVKHALGKSEANLQQLLEKLIDSQEARVRPT